MTKAPEPKRRGRPRVLPGQSKAREVCSVRLSVAEQAALRARGGWPAFRAWLTGDGGILDSHSKTMMAGGAM